MVTQQSDVQMTSVVGPTGGPDLLAVTSEDEGPLTAHRREALEQHVSQGGAALVSLRNGDPEAAALAGCRVVEQLPATEWFVTLAECEAGARLDGEVPIATSLCALQPLDDTTVAATTSIRFEHKPTITVRRLGDGVVVGTGIGDIRALLDHPTLGRFVRRLGRAGQPKRTTPLGIGVVGYGPFGGMGYLHGLAATETQGLALVAAADSSHERLVAAQGDFPDLAIHDSASALAADDNVDIAIVATPPSHHAEIGLELLRANKHVVVEKPMCLRTEDADLMMQVARENGRVLTVHQSRRWDRDYLALQRLIESGRIGDAFNIETFVGGFEHPCRAWHSEESISGGAIYDWGSHHVDWIIQLYGSAPERVMCTTHTRVWHDTTNVDQLSLWMQWDDGREATFRQSDVAAIRRPKFYVQGTVGTVEGHYAPISSVEVQPGRGYVDSTSHHAEAPVDLTVSTYASGNGLTESTVRPADHPGWGFHRNLADHLLLGEALAVEPQQSRDVVAVLEAGHASGQAGGSVIELS